MCMYFHLWSSVNLARVGGVTGSFILSLLLRCWLAIQAQIGPLLAASSVVIMSTYL